MYGRNVLDIFFRLMFVTFSTFMAVENKNNTNYNNKNVGWLVRGCVKVLGGLSEKKFDIFGEFFPIIGVARIPKLL